MPTDAQVDKALELIQKGGGNYEYFFNKLSSPAWIVPLSKRGRFSHPPPIERVDENMFRYPRWPEGDYLLRMASAAPDEVAAAIEPVCFESNNVLVHLLLIDIAAKLPPTLSRDIAIRETAWVGKQASLFTLYPEKAASLVEHLAYGGEATVALGFASAMLEVRAPKDTHKGTPIEIEDGSTHILKPSPDPEGKMEPVWSQVFLRRVLEPLSLAIPDRFLASLTENLNRAVSIYTSNQLDDSDDYSTIWRPDIEHGSHYETLDEAVSALAGAITVLSDQEADFTPMIMAAFKPYTWPIFDRLRAFTLLRASNPDPAQVAEFLSDPSKYERPSKNPEFTELLKKRATALAEDTLKKILDRIDAGPDPASYAYHLKHRVQPDNVEAETMSIIERWKLEWLHPLAAALDNTRTEELNRLLEKYNPPQPHFHSSGVMALQDHSPTNLDSFKGMSAVALVKYLKEWTPPISGHPFERPSRAGAANTLREWVSDDPQRASEVLEHFMTIELDPAYISAMLDAFSASLKTDKQFDVYAVARAAQWVAEHTDALAEPKGDGWNREATWNWAHMSSARFMAELMLQEQRLDIARATELFPVLRALCFLPHPTVEDEIEYKKEASRYASFAVNTPRPVGVEAMVRYGRWMKLATPEAEFVPALLAPVLEVLEQKLDAAKEPSAAVREMFGMQFRTLAWLDIEWFKSVIPKLFPGRDGTSKEEKTLDRFAWNSYLQYGGLARNTFPATRKRYQAAVKALQKGDEPVRDIDRKLANHLMQYYAHGAIELDDPLLVQFFASASVKLRAQAVGDIGWNLGRDTTPLSPEIQTRLMRLWESRMPLLAAGSKEDADELGTFGWWFASGKFPDEWAIAQAMPILEYLRSLRPDFAVVKALNSVSAKYPYEAVRVVRVLFEDDRDGWAIHGWNQYLDGILKQALNDGELARKEAEQMIELLVAKGFRGYRNLHSRNGGQE